MIKNFLRFFDKKVAREMSKAESLVSEHYQRFLETSQKFEETLISIKANNPSIPWYPYNTLNNLKLLSPLVPSIDNMFAHQLRVADIGAADGDTAFCLENAGHIVDMYDYGPTNFNDLHGAQFIKKTLSSNVSILEHDLDAQLVIDKSYDLIFFLGILYHLKNPYFVLEQLSYKAKYLLISTRVCRHFSQGGPDVSQTTAVYLLGPDELNNDSTNFWIFTESSLIKLFHRTGWQVVASRSVGDTVASNPQDNQHDERILALLKSGR